MHMSPWCMLDGLSGSDTDKDGTCTCSAFPGNAERFSDGCPVCPFHFMTTDLFLQITSTFIIILSFKFGYLVCVKTMSHCSVNEGRLLFFFMVPKLEQIEQALLRDIAQQGGLAWTYLAAARVTPTIPSLCQSVGFIISELQKMTRDFRLAKKKCSAFLRIMPQFVPYIIFGMFLGIKC